MKLTLQLGVLSAANLALAFIAQWYIFTVVGPGSETDALFAGMAIPQLVLVVTASSLMHVLVPLLSGKDDNELSHDAWAFLILITGLFGVLALSLYIAAPWWVPLVFPGFSDAGQALTVMLTRVQIVGMVFSAMSSVQLSAYHARQRFLWAEFIPVFLGALTLGLLIWTVPQYGVVAAAWITTLKLGIQSLMLMSGMGRPVIPDLRKPIVRQAWKRIKPLLIGTAFYKTDPLIDRALLSMATPGTVSLYYFAQQISGSALRIVNKSIIVPLVPALSRLNKSHDMTAFRRAVARKLIKLTALSILGIIALILFGKSALHFLIGHGHVTKENVTDLWWIMIWLSGSFVGGMLGQVTSASFYSVGDTSTPTRIGIYTYSIFIPIKLILFYYFSVIGVALAASMFAMINVLVQLHYFQSLHLHSGAESSND